ncbi:MAG: hypothetical protein A2X64_01700 [Ignavibacteria bacterium GWF2_33_9]|nr:MAG: hypothetical protein A2X64_01700 [Ignavibacteria bacterium GWF2_33_9]
MKRLFTILFFIFAFAPSVSFSISDFSYSGVAYDNTGQIIISQNIEVQVQINDGTTLFLEEFLSSASVSTNEFGVFTVQIGSGTKTSQADLSEIVMKSNTNIIVKVRRPENNFVTIAGTSLANLYLDNFQKDGTSGGNYFTIPSSSTEPTNPTVGQFYYNTEEKRLYYYNGEFWEYSQTTPKLFKGKIHSKIDGISGNMKTIELADDGNKIALMYSQSEPPYKVFINVFQYNGNSWIKMGSDIETEEYYDSNILTFSHDGSTVAFGNGSFDNHKGIVSVFKWEGIDWVQKGNSILGDNPYEELGRSIDLNENGNVIFIGSPGYNSNYGKGSVYEFNGNEWIQKGQSIIGNDEYGNVGLNSSISADGNSIAVQGRYWIQVFYFNQVWLQKGNKFNSYFDQNSTFKLSYSGNLFSIGGQVNNYNSFKVWIWDEFNWEPLGNSISMPTMGGEVMLAYSSNLRFCSFLSNNDTYFGKISVYTYWGGEWVKLSNEIEGTNELYFSDIISMNGDGSRLAAGVYELGQNYILIYE